MKITIELFSFGAKALRPQPLPVVEPALVPDGPESARKHGGEQHDY
jgi:hypothetical protein